MIFLVLAVVVSVTFRAQKTLACGVAFNLGRGLSGETIEGGDSHNESHWIDTPSGRIPYAVTINGSGNGVLCQGVLLTPKTVLMAGSCLANVQPDPEVIISSEDENNNGKSGHVEQKLLVKSSRMHPKWRGEVGGINDCAMLILKHGVNHPTPVLPDPKYNVYPNSVVHKITRHPRRKASPLVVVSNSLCTRGIPLADGMLCTDTHGTKIHPGGPLMVLDDPPWRGGDTSAISSGRPEKDVVVGICSTVSPHNGRFMGCATIASMRAWIDKVIQSTLMHKPIFCPYMWLKYFHLL